MYLDSASVAQVNPRSFLFHRLSVEANTLGSRLEKGVCSIRSICSESWEQNCDTYLTCPDYFSEQFQSATDKYGVDCRSLSKTRVVVIRCFFIQHLNGHIQPLRQPKTENFRGSASNLGGLAASPTDPPSTISPVFLFFQVGTSGYLPN